MKYGIYFAYWTKEWQADYKYYIQKVKKLGFDVLEISCMAQYDEQYHGSRSQRTGYEHTNMVYPYHWKHKYKVQNSDNKYCSTYILMRLHKKYIRLFQMQFSRHRFHQQH